MVDCENMLGFIIMTAIMKIIASEKNRPEKFCLMLKIKKFLFCSVFVFVIIKYMLK